MDEKRDFSLSRSQKVLLAVTAIGFIIFTWEMIPLENLIKVFIFLFLSIAALLLVVTFAQYLCYFQRIKSTRMATTIAVIIFAVFPFVINVIHDVHKKEYLLSLPTDNQIAVRITYKIDRIGGSGSIGDEWVYTHFLNNTEFKNGDILTVDAKTSFFIKSRFIEQDSISDIGETISKKYRYSENDNYKRTITFSQKVHVVEKGGRRYAGSTADFNVTYVLKRVIPQSMNYWEVFLYTSAKTEYALCLSVLAGEILCWICVVYVLRKGKERMAYVQEQIFLSEKSAFIASLQGRSVREAARVPSNVFFVNGLPVDNNDATYGSFTVYCSNNGACYHEKKGCCSANRPMHSFKIRDRLRPCSRCCKRKRTIPQWYVDYTALEKQAKRYRIDISE